MAEQEVAVEPAPKVTWLAKLTRVGHDLSKRTILVIAAGSAVVVALSIVLAAVALTSRSSQPKPAPIEKPLRLEDILAVLDEGNFAKARKLAERLRRKLPAQEAGGALFVLGAAAAYEAEEFLGRERRDRYLLAANYLQDARHLGMPTDRIAEGTYLLGKSLNLSGKYVESRRPLEDALEVAPQRGESLHWLLAAAYAKGGNRDLPKALDHIESYLAIDHDDPQDRYAGLLEKLRILYQMKDDAACQSVLKEIPREASIYPDAVMIRGRMAMRDAQRLKQKLQQDSESELSAEAKSAQEKEIKRTYEEAIQILRRAQDDPLGGQTIRRSRYLIGVCFLEMQDPRAALAQFEWTRKVWLDTPEGLAAGLQEADLLRRASRNEEAQVAYLRVLGAAKAPFANDWIPPDQFRGRVLDVYRQHLAENQFEQAIALAESFYPLFAPARAAEYAAEALQAWSTSLVAEAAVQNEPEATETRRRSRALARKAGRSFAELARLEYSSRQYTEDLWRSAEAFLAGHDFRSAVATFDEYLKYETRRRRPRALIDMGQCYLALGLLDESLAVCQECVQFYLTDPAIYQARLVISRVLVEKGDMAGAEAILRENLNGDLLAPESKEWRESLFRLGELLQATGRHEEAIQKLREAVERYPDASEVVQARYLIGESYRQLAKAVQDKLAKDTIETTRVAHRKELQSWVTSAVQFYKQVQDGLNRRQEQARLSLVEKAILRNSYFAEGAAWFDLERYDDAILAYSTIINRYQHDPEALEAFVQISTCYRRSKRQTEARGTIQQAKVVLERMRPDAPFAEVTNHTRREWIELLDWLTTL